MREIKQYGTITRDTLKVVVLKNKKNIGKLKPMVKNIIIILLWVTVFSTQLLAIVQNPKQTKSTPSISEATIVSGNTTFGLTFFNQITDKKSNIIFSPFSLSTGFAMLYPASNGQTKKEIQSAFNFSEHQDDFMVAYGQHHHYLTSLNNKKNIEFYSANAFWADKSYSFNKNYLKRINKEFEANIFPMSFKSPHHVNSATNINRWVTEKTKGKITKILQPKDILDQAFVLTNAVYFKGNWANAFNPKKTKKQTFYDINDQEIYGMFMHQKNTFPFAMFNWGTAIELPYEGNYLSMIIVLPNKNSKFSSLTSEIFSNILTNLKPRKVMVSLPKFKIESNIQNITTKLNDRHLITAFGKYADFSGLSQSNKRHFRISKIAHKATIEVSEKGSEASAVTTIVGARITSIEPIDIFMANRPFFIIIKDNKTNSILFLGKLNTLGDVVK